MTFFCIFLLFVALVFTLAFVCTRDWPEAMLCGVICVAIGSILYCLP